MVEPEHINTDKKPIKSNYSSKLREYSTSFFRKYVESIDKYPDKFFDLVFIDGRVRKDCILHSINKIKFGGYLMMDNTDERKYKLAQNFLKKYKKIDFFGIAPQNPYLNHSKVSFWKATSWKIQ